MVRRKKVRKSAITAARLEALNEPVEMRVGGGFDGALISECIKSFIENLQEEMRVDGREVELTIQLIQNQNPESLMQDSQWMIETRRKLQRALAIEELSEVGKQERVMLIHGALCRLGRSA